MMLQMGDSKSVLNGVPNDVLINVPKGVLNGIPNGILIVVSNVIQMAY